MKIYMSLFHSSTYVIHFEKDSTIIIFEIMCKCARWDRNNIQIVFDTNFET